jgi:salicylate hydroxylase
MDKQKRIEVDIYEAAAELSEIGAGIHLWPRSFKMLAKVGLEEEVLRFCERANEDSCAFSFFMPDVVAYSEIAIAFQFRKSDQEKGHHIFDMSIKGLRCLVHHSSSIFNSVL